MVFIFLSFLYFGAEEAGRLAGFGLGVGIGFLLLIFDSVVFLYFQLFIIYITSSLPVFAFLLSSFEFWPRCFEIFVGLDFKVGKNLYS